MKFRFVDSAIVPSLILALLVLISFNNLTSSTYVDPTNRIVDISSNGQAIDDVNLEVKGTFLLYLHNHLRSFRIHNEILVGINSKACV